MRQPSLTRLFMAITLAFATSAALAQTAPGRAGPNASVNRTAPVAAPSNASTGAAASVASSNGSSGNAQATGTTTLAVTPNGAVAIGTPIAGVQAQTSGTNAQGQTAGANTQGQTSGTGTGSTSPGVVPSGVTPLVGPNGQPLTDATGRPLAIDTRNIGLLPGSTPMPGAVVVGTPIDQVAVEPAATGAGGNAQVIVLDAASLNGSVTSTPELDRATRKELQKAKSASRSRNKQTLYSITPRGNADRSDQMADDPIIQTPDRPLPRY